MAKIQVKESEITVLSINENDYISLTDIAKHKSDDPTAVISNWMRNRNTIEYLGMWETIFNPDFKPLEFEGFRKEAGLNAFTLSPQKWVTSTGAKEFQRLKEQEQAQIGWTAKRELAKINYHIHTSAVSRHLIPQKVTAEQTRLIYASEADVLNVALFGMTAKQWRDSNPDLDGNIRDHASINQLICLSNMESMNSVLIESGLAQHDRLIKLNEMAIHQMEILSSNGKRELLK